MEPVREVVLYVNGSRRQLSPCPPTQTLLDFLRRNERLTGAKLGCGEGGCGACTVLLSRFDRSASRIRHAAVNACLMPLAAADGCAVTTVEGVGLRGRLAPLQRALASAHASQCGFCTLGIVFGLGRKGTSTRSTWVSLLILRAAFPLTHTRPQLNRSTARMAGWPRGGNTSRKVRTPQSTVPGNARRG